MTSIVKHTLLALLCLLATTLALQAQEQKSEQEKELAQRLREHPLRHLGLDDEPELTAEEALFLNERFALVRSSFDFRGTRVLFSKGSGMRSLVTKSDYFTHVIKPLIANGFITPEVLWIIPEFKQAEVGYDALITLWVNNNPPFEQRVSFIDFAALQGDPRRASLGKFGHFDKLGLNNNPLVSDFEAEFLNAKLEKQRNDFDFRGKRVAFVAGDMADTLVTKAAYFKENEEYLTLNKLGTFDELLVLTPHEQALSNGYDAVILSGRYYCFALSPNMRRKLMLNLSKLH